ncbi:heme peroxidase [Haematococcus lacustris]
MQLSAAQASGATLVHRKQCRAASQRIAPRALPDAHIESQESASRRALLLAGGAVAASPLMIVRPSRAATRLLPVENLSSFQRQDQRLEMQLRAQSALQEVLTASDAPAAVRLALHEAATYDIATKTGGFDGSIALNAEELARPENAGLADIVAKVGRARDAVNGSNPNNTDALTWADAIFMAGRVATQLSWYEIKLGRAQTSSGGKLIATAFKNPWPVDLGRIDSTEAGPGRLPPLDADVATIRKFMLALGAKPGAGANPFSPKAPFWERPAFLLWTASAPDPEAEEQRFAEAFPDPFKDIKRSFDISRRTVTRTDYEVDFAAAYNKLCGLGAKINPTAYLYPVPIQIVI